jgi:alanine-synthesizing transaminase
VATRASELLAPGGRLYDRAAPFLSATPEQRFLAWRRERFDVRLRARQDGRAADFDDQVFALDLLEQKHVLLAPGTSFNVPYRDHFRTTLLPEAALLKKVFVRIDELLSSYASRPSGDKQRVVHAESRFK